jgi:hypothetical protein
VTVEKIQIDAVKPYADRRYEWVEGTVRFAVDPQHQANQRIVDLNRAPGGDDGVVRFEADLRLLRPSDGGSGNFLFEMPNRGIVSGFTFGMGGDAFLLDRGAATCAAARRSTRVPAGRRSPATVPRRRRRRTPYRSPRS